MRFGLSLVIAAAALLSGCTPSNEPTNSTAAKTPDTYRQQITALSDPARRGVFLRAISDAGFACQKVVSDQVHAPIDHVPTWVARCEQRKPYVLMLQPGGVLDVTPIAAASDDSAH